MQNNTQKINVKFLQGIYEIARDRYFDEQIGY